MKSTSKKASQTESQLQRQLTGGEKIKKRAAESKSEPSEADKVISGKGARRDGDEPSE